MFVPAFLGTALLFEMLLFFEAPPSFGISPLCETFALSQTLLQISCNLLLSLLLDRRVFLEVAGLLEVLAFFEAPVFFEVSAFFDVAIFLAVPALFEVPAFFDTFVVFGILVLFETGLFFGLSSQLSSSLGLLSLFTYKTFSPLAFSYRSYILKSKDDDDWVKMRYNGA